LLLTFNGCLAQAVVVKAHLLNHDVCKPIAFLIL